MNAALILFLVLQPQEHEGCRPGFTSSRGDVVMVGMKTCKGKEEMHASVQEIQNARNDIAGRKRSLDPALKEAKANYEWAASQGLSNMGETKRYKKEMERIETKRAELDAEDAELATMLPSEDEKSEAEKSHNKLLRSVKKDMEELQSMLVELVAASSSLEAQARQYHEKYISIRDALLQAKSLERDYLLPNSGVELESEDKNKRLLQLRFTFIDRLLAGELNEAVLGEMKTLTLGSYTDEGG